VELVRQQGGQFAGLALGAIDDDDFRRAGRGQFDRRRPSGLPGAKQHDPLSGGVCRVANRLHHALALGVLADQRIFFTNTRLTAPMAAAASVVRSNRGMTAC